jgi:hypothetical protein
MAIALTNLALEEFLADDDGTVTVYELKMER